MKKDQAKPAASPWATIRRMKSALAAGQALTSVVTSSHTGEGVPELRAAIAQLLAERGA